MNLPADPFMLLSVINTKLRDEYAGPDELCASEGISREELDRRLGEAGFDYLPTANQYR